MSAAGGGGAAAALASAAAAGRVPGPLPGPSWIAQGWTAVTWAAWSAANPYLAFEILKKKIFVPARWEDSYGSAVEYIRDSQSLLVLKCGSAQHQAIARSRINTGNAALLAAAELRVNATAYLKKYRSAKTGDDEQAKYTAMVICSLIKYMQLTLVKEKLKRDVLDLIDTFGKVWIQQRKTSPLEIENVLAANTSTAAKPTGFLGSVAHEPMPKDLMKFLLDLLREEVANGTALSADIDSVFDLHSVRGAVTESTALLPRFKSAQVADAFLAKYDKLAVMVPELLSLEQASDIRGNRVSGGVSERRSQHFTPPYRRIADLLDARVKTNSRYTKKSNTMPLNRLSRSQPMGFSPFGIGRSQASTQRRKAKLESRALSSDMASGGPPPSGGGDQLVLSSGTAAGTGLAPGPSGLGSLRAPALEAIEEEKQKTNSTEVMEGGSRRNCQRRRRTYRRR